MIDNLFVICYLIHILSVCNTPHLKEALKLKGNGSFSS